jgi:hypothetical protein
LPLCMGHSPPSAQQAMRASAVGIQPAQIAAFPAIRPNVSARAARRWTSLTTYLGCSTGGAVSNGPLAESTAIPTPLPSAVLRWPPSRRRSSSRPRRQESAHNQCVRRLLAAAMLILFASLNAIDGICCPDGCTHEQSSTPQPHERQSSDGTCVLCVGGVESSIALAQLPSPIVTSRIALPLFTHHLDAPTDPPDHPPRS